MSKREVLVNLFALVHEAKPLTQLHAQALKIGFSHDSFFATKLHSLYAKHNSLAHALKLFDETPHRTVYLWNSLLRSYCREKKWEDTLHFFSQMISQRTADGFVKPDNFTLSIVLKASAGLSTLSYGKMVHGIVKRNESIGLDMFVGAALIELYSKCGKMGDALKVFDEFREPDVVLWTSMVTGYEQNGYPEEALVFFSEMVVKGNITATLVTLVSLVSACAQLLNAKLGCGVHGFVIRRGFESDLTLMNSLLNLYAKTGYVRAANNLFRLMKERDVISWSSMVSCYAHNGNVVEALVVFREMIAKGYEPNAVTSVSALQACAVGCDLKEGKKIHQLATRRGFELEVSVSTALIDMYMKCLSPDEAVNVFQRMPKKDVVSWVALLSGYALNGMAYRSMEVFCEMLRNGTRPDAVAMLKLLTSCSKLGILQQVVCIHGFVVRSGFETNVFVGASLIDFYSKCGSLDNAVKVFEGTIDKDIVSWSSMISGYGIHGQGGEALKLFSLILDNSTFKPNNVIFLSVLSACSHAGLVEEGIEIFNRMVNEYRLHPDLEHYAIMVDLLARKGELEKAMNFIEQMPIPAGPHVWGALLGGARIHHNTEMGGIAARNLCLLDPTHTGYHVLMANINALEGKWDCVAEVRSLMKDKGLKKMLGQSVVEVK